jgi:hypothetical protein
LNFITEFQNWLAKINILAFLPTIFSYDLEKTKLSRPTISATQAVVAVPKASRGHFVVPLI